MGMGFLSQIIRMFWNYLRWFQNPVNILKSMELYTFKG